MTANTYYFIALLVVMGTLAFILGFFTSRKQ